MTCINVILFFGIFYLLATFLYFCLYGSKRASFIKSHLFLELFEKLGPNHVKKHPRKRGDGIFWKHRPLLVRYILLPTIKPSYRQIIFLQCWKIGWKLSWREILIFIYKYLQIKSSNLSHYIIRIIENRFLERHLLWDAR